MQDYVTVNKQAYEDVAPEYLNRAGKSTEPLEELAGKPLRHTLQNFKGAITVLEIGPGSGEICTYFEEHGCKTVAIDVAPKILENVKIISPRTKLIEADILSYEIQVESFELIYCGALIHLFTVSDATRIMDNIFQALKPNGILFINTTIHANSGEGYYEKYDYNRRVKRYRHRYTKREFETLVKNTSLEIIDQLATDEDSRDKHWLAYICRKST